MQKIELQHFFTFKNACPYCDGDLHGSADAWEENDNGELKASDLDLNCSNFPDVNSPTFDAEYKEFKEEHSYLVYEYWHPTIRKLKDEINSKYIFKYNQ